MATETEKPEAGKAAFHAMTHVFLYLALLLVRKLDATKGDIETLGLFDAFEDTSKFKKCSVEVLKSVTKGLLRGRVTNYYVRQKLPGSSVNGESSIKLGKRNRSSYNNGNHNVRKKIF